MDLVRSTDPDVRGLSNRTFRASPKMGAICLISSGLPGLGAAQPQLGLDPGKSQSFRTKGLAPSLVTSAL